MHILRGKNNLSATNMCIHKTIKMTVFSVLASQDAFLSLSGVYSVAACGLSEHLVVLGLLKTYSRGEAVSVRMLVARIWLYICITSSQ
jgi:hypothetical protein